MSGASSTEPPLRAGNGSRTAPSPVLPFAPPTRRRRRPSWRITAAAAVVLLAVLAGVGWVVFGSALLTVERVTVTGARKVAPAEVIARAGVEPGTPLAQVDIAAVRTRVGSIRRVADVDVERRWPSTLALVVTERVPVASVARQREFAIVDAAAVELERRPKPLDGTPTIHIAGSSPDRSLEAALDVLGALPPGLRESVHRITATSPDAVSLVLDGGRRVVWGSPERSERKALVLDVLLSHSAKVYDVSAPDAPTTR